MPVGNPVHPLDLSLRRSSNLRPSPTIVDHEIIGMIGRGAYGEVWMGRTLTGSYRAVKVVWRIDYDNEDAFEREFAGIRHYEPISRIHPGLVDILQVGRNDEEGFYYYIMEIGDDVERGRDIDPDNYRPRNFSAATKGGRLPLEDCLRHGSRLADALHLLHENDLIHRDVKPSNVIFVNGEPRLADMGLVTLSGQRSFVGTEGFVPPEGPGTPSADLYSLGMVLYEAATGKDRLDFPDLPSHLHTPLEARQWRLLNSVICKACAPRVEDRFKSGKEMAEALAVAVTGADDEVVRKRPGRWIHLAAVLAVLMVAGAGGLALSQWRSADAWMGGWLTARGVPGGSDARAPEALLTIESTPPGAEVYRGSERLGVTPLAFDPPPGQALVYQIRLPGHRHVTLTHTAEAGRAEQLQVALERWRQPQEGELWTNSLDMEFAPRRGGHRAIYPTQIDAFNVFVEAEKRSFEGQIVPLYAEARIEPVYAVLVPGRDIEAFRSWLYERERTEGYLGPEQAYRVEVMFLPDLDLDGIGFIDDLVAVQELDPMEADVREQFAFRLVVERREYGTVHIESMPQGAEVLADGLLIGRTPLTIPRVRTGPVRYEIRSEGFDGLLLDGEVMAEELLRFSVNLEERRTAVFGREWSNSLEWTMVPVGELLVAAVPVTRGDYAAFARESGVDMPPSPDQQDFENLPVTRVSRTDATEFARWLTDREREQGLITLDMAYRLPTDLEWSRMAGLPMERGSDAASRSGRIRGVYPWGFLWPPPAGAGNFADSSALEADHLRDVIADYHDGFPKLAPVGTFNPNSFGIHDLAGNVAEWLEDDFGGNDPTLSSHGIVRGGSWRSFQQDELLSSTRLAVPAESREPTIGFRLVLSRNAVRRPVPAFDPFARPARTGDTAQGRGPQNPTGSVVESVQEEGDGTDP